MTESSVFAEILTALAKDLRDRGGVNLSEGFIDGTFVPAKKEAMMYARPKGAKESIMGLKDAFGLPIAIITTSANPYEVTLVNDIQDDCCMGKLPERLVDETALDSHQLDKYLVR